jgi:hypothetical protein
MMSTGASPAYGQSPYYPPTYPDPRLQQPTEVAQARKSRTLAIVGLVVAIAGLIILPFIGGVAAMALGALSVGYNPAKSGNGMAYTAIVIGGIEWIVFVVATVILVLMPVLGAG